MKVDETMVDQYRDMLFTRYRIASVVTHEPHVEILTSEVKILFDILSDYTEVLHGRTDDNI